MPSTAKKTQGTRGSKTIGIAYGISDLKGDAYGGITSGASILPQAMGYGIFSGLGPVAGLYGAIAVCLFAAVFGGTRGMIGGPNLFVAVAMSIVAAEYADNLPEALTVVMLSGLIQVSFGVLKLGRYVSYVPYLLVSGFFTAAGIMIIASQVFPAVGAPSVSGGIVSSVRAWPGAIANANLHAVAVTVISLAVSGFWPRRLAKFAPAYFVALVLSALAGMLVFRAAPVIGDIPFEAPILYLPILSVDVLVRMLEPAFIIAVLSSVSTLMVALQVESITGIYHRPNQEIVSHGLGNMAAGAIGGLPGGMNGATMANVACGGRSQAAGIIAGLALLLLVTGVRQIAEGIPYAALSGILIVIGWNFIDRRLITRIHRIPKSYVVILLITVLLALFVSFADAMLIGIVAAALIAAKRSENSELDRLLSLPLLDRAILGKDSESEGADPFSARTGLVVFPDRVSVASARELGRIVGRDISGHEVLILDLSKTSYVDDTAAVAIGQLATTAMSRFSGQVVIVGLRGMAADSLCAMNLLADVPGGNFAPDIVEAKQIAASMLTRVRP